MPATATQPVKLIVEEDESLAIGECVCRTRSGAVVCVPRWLAGGIGAGHEQDRQPGKPGSLYCRFWCWWHSRHHSADDRGNYSVQETFGDNTFFWAGVRWFEQILQSDRFWASLGRQLFFTFTILLIEVPLGVAIALSMPKKGPWVSVCLVLMARRAAYPVECRRRDVEHFRASRHRPSRKTAELDRIPLQLHPRDGRRLVHVILMDVWHWTSLVVLLAYAGLVSIPTPIIRRQRSTALRAGKSSASSSCRR